MPAGEELQKALGNLVDAVRRVWEEAHAVSAPSEKPELNDDSNVVHVRHGNFIDFPNSTELVEYDRLIRIIANSSMAADRLYLYASQQRKMAADASPETKEPLVTNAGAMAYAVRMRDSLKTLVELLGGDWETITPDWVAPSHKVLSLEDNEHLVVYYEPGCEKLALKLAETYQKIKELRDETAYSGVKIRLDTILSHIRKDATGHERMD